MSLSATMVRWRAGNSPIISDIVCSSRSFCLHFSTSSLLKDHTPSSTAVDGGTKSKKIYHSQNKNDKFQNDMKRFYPQRAKGWWYKCKRSVLIHKQLTKMKSYLIGSDKKQRPHARRAFCHRLRAAMALLNVTGIGLSPRWNLQNGTRPAYKGKTINKYITNIPLHLFIFLHVTLFLHTSTQLEKASSIKLFHTQKQTWGEKF